MRLWHKNLIPVLPREQLVAQWREISSIADSIQKKGTPNHLLVNFVLDYDFDHFINYAAAVRSEMTSRSYRTMDSVWNKIVELKPDYQILPFDEIYKEKMNKDYFQICYFNLYEKYLCGGIKEEDMNKIDAIYKCQFNEWISKILKGT